MERNSSIEIYRIIATIAVLVFHFNGWLVGGMPKQFDLEHLSMFRFSQAVIESFSCICVNMFLVISGYFGLRLKWHSVFQICLLLFSIHIPFYVMDVMFFNETFTLKDFIRKLMIISNGGYFIQCYLMLMFLSPVINSFIEKYGKNGLRWCMMFLIVEYWFDCVTHVEFFGFNHGYSVLHFILIYMLARYIFLYKDKLMQFKKRYWVAGYVFCSFVIFLMYVLNVNYIWQYSNPVVVVSSVCSFMPFLYRNYVNRWVNWVAQSTLAVYIIHVTVPVYHLVVRFDNYILYHYNYSVYLLLMLWGVISIFFISILYDKVRLVFTNPIYNYMIKFVAKHKDGKSAI